MGRSPNNVENVSGAKPKATGAINIAKLGTPVPADGIAALDPSFENCGYVSEDGLTTMPKRSSNTTKAWGGDTVMDEQTEFSDGCSFTLIESNVTTLGLVFGENNVTLSPGGIAIIHNSDSLPPVAMVIEMLMSGDRVRRIEYPHAKVSEVGDIVFKDSDPIGYQLTIKALPDASGNTAYEYIAKIAE